MKAACICVYLPTIVFAHQAGEGVRQRGGAPAVPLAPRVAVLPTFLLQLLQPVVHDLSAGGLEPKTCTRSLATPLPEIPITAITVL